MSGLHSEMPAEPMGGSKPAFWRLSPHPRHEIIALKPYEIAIFFPISSRKLCGRGTRTELVPLTRDVRDIRQYERRENRAHRSVRARDDHLGRDFARVSCWHCFFFPRGEKIHEPCARRKRTGTRPNRIRRWMGAGREMTGRRKLWSGRLSTSGRGEVGWTRNAICPLVTRHGKLRPFSRRK